MNAARLESPSPLRGGVGEGGARKQRSLLTALLLAAATTTADAHNRSVSYSHWTVADDGLSLRVELRLPRGELNRASIDPYAPATADLLASELRAGLEPRSADGPCRNESSTAANQGEVWLLQGRWRCTQPVRALRSRFLQDRIPGHLQMTQIDSAAGARGPYALSAGQNSLALDAAAAPPSLGRYLGLGAEHILAGWDHLAFLLVLVLGAASLGQLAWRVSGFTLGHSLTLALATLGALRPPAAMVEAFIALTIACTAAERLLAGQPRAGFHAATITALLALVGAAAGVLPWLLLPAALLLSLGSGADARLDSLRSSLFGLFHGFGFAGVLATLNQDQPLPALPLFGFNLGVELGQLLFVLPVYWLARRWPALRATPALPAAVLALGCGWFFIRLT
ncbi:MAG: HupE/UreJ family protein [Stagnimonas sp.]|nr:HupE/UreJ family protein [Stagnimonas sp.]